MKLSQDTSKNRSKTGKYQRNIKLFEDKSSVNILNKIVNLAYLLKVDLVNQSDITMHKINTINWLFYTYCK